MVCFILSGSAEFIFCVQQRLNGQLSSALRKVHQVKLVHDMELAICPEEGICIKYCIVYP